VLKPYSEEAVIEASQSALREAGGKVTLGFVFASPDYQEALPDFLELIQLHGHLPHLVGCSGSGMVGTDREVEGATGFSLLFLHLPETKLHFCELEPADVEWNKSAEEWHRLTKTALGEADAWIALADPYGFPVEPWLAEWNEAYPRIPIIGGLASGSGQAKGEDVFLFHNRSVLAPGSAVLVGIQGAGLKIRALLSQGCRPIGEPLTITGSNANVVTALGGKPAYAALAEAYESLSDDDKARAQGNLFAGLASTEYIEDFKRGDFLIRTILGADAGSGVVALGAYPRVGQTLQWQLRDRGSADADLRERLAGQHHRQPHPFASLVFACNGRGADLFGSPNHDAHALAQTTGKAPSAGLFCNGEIGPVGDRSFMHGFTVSMALFA